MAEDRQFSHSPKITGGGRRTPMTGESERGTGVAADATDKKSSPQAQTSGKRRRRCRRKRKAGEHHQQAGRQRQWKPYSKMTWEERQKADERITIRANRVRERRFKSGLAMAPYNTTQFLMEQHEPTGSEQCATFPFLELDMPQTCPPGRSSGSVTGESSVADVDDAGAEVMFMEKEFAEEYENFRAERLQTLTKEELVRDYVDLERKLEKMQQSRMELSDRESTTEVEQLRRENARLSAENDSLRTELAKLRTLRKTSDE